MTSWGQQTAPLVEAGVALAVPLCGSLKVPSPAPSSRAAAAAWASTSSALVAVELAVFAVGGRVDAGRARTLRGAHGIAPKLRDRWRVLEGMA